MPYSPGERMLTTVGQERIERRLQRLQSIARAYRRTLFVYPDPINDSLSHEIMYLLQLWNDIMEQIRSERNLYVGPEF
jgi:hypothetical protein